MELDELQETVAQELEQTGRTYFQVESTYWGNEAFGSWTEEFTGELAVETEKGVKFEEVRTLGGTALGQGWLPKSKVVKQVTGPEPQDHVLVTGDGIQSEGVPASEGDYQISKTDYYQGRYKRHPKLVVDFEYDSDMKENLKRPDEDSWWNRFHPSANFDAQDNFKNWTIDADINVVEFAQELAEGGYSVTIREEFIE